MSLKSIIRRKTILQNEDLPTPCVEFTMGKAPLIYSEKHATGLRMRPENFFRRKQWKSVLKCVFPAYYSKNIPTVIYLRIYVRPFAGIRISKKLLKAEKTPAVEAYEICDYLLELMDYLFGVLYSTHRQVCKICVEKYYSDDPRLVLTYTSWEDYGQLCSKNPHEPFAEAFRQGWARRRLEPEQIWDESIEGMASDEFAGEGDPTITIRPPADDSAFPHSPSPRSYEKEKRKRTPEAACPEAGHRQPVEVPE